MTLEERMARQLEVAKRRLDDLGKEEVIWKQRLADAVLVLVAEGREITAETLRNRLLAMGEKVAKIAGTEISLEATRIASETAIAHLEKAIAAQGEKKDEE